MRAKNAPFLRACAHFFARTRAFFARTRAIFAHFLAKLYPNGGIGRMPHIRFKGGRMCIYAILPKAYAYAYNTLAQTNPANNGMPLRKQPCRLMDKNFSSPIWMTSN